MCLSTYDSRKHVSEIEEPNLTGSVLSNCHKSRTEMWIAIRATTYMPISGVSGTYCSGQLLEHLPI